jgi:hypothetical protein
MPLFNRPPARGLTPPKPKTPIEFINKVEEVKEIKEILRKNITNPG